MVPRKDEELFKDEIMCKEFVPCKEFMGYFGDLVCGRDASGNLFVGTLVEDVSKHQKDILHITEPSDKFDIEKKLYITPLHEVTHIRRLACDELYKPFYKIKEDEVSVGVSDGAVQ